MTSALTRTRSKDVQAHVGAATPESTAKVSTAIVIGAFLYAGWHLLWHAAR